MSKSLICSNVLFMSNCGQIACFLGGLILSKSLVGAQKKILTGGTPWRI
jgi:hypothetical protein